MLGHPVVVGVAQRDLGDLFLLLARAPEHDEAARRARCIRLVPDGLRPR